MLYRKVVFIKFSLITQRLLLNVETEDNGRVGENGKHNYV